MVAQKQLQVRTPKQERAVRSQARILIAAEDLFFEKGYEDTRIDDIAKRAKCSVGTFYHLFKDKSEVFNFMFNQYDEDIRQKARDMDLKKPTQVSLTSALTHFANEALTFFHERRGLRRAILDLTPKDAELSHRVTEITKLFCDQLGHVHADYSEEIEHPNAEEKLRQCAQLIQGIASQTAMRKDKIYFPEDRDQFAEMLVSACKGILNS